MSQDPQAAAARNGTVHVVVRDAWGGLWQQGFTEGTAAGWQGWVYKGGVLQDYSLAAVLGEWYVAGRDNSNALWWYRSIGNVWTTIGHFGVATTPLAAAPR